MRQGKPPDMLPVEAVQEEYSNFCNKMNKFRAVKKLKDAPPQTPVKRFASMKAYLSSRKSPTVSLEQLLQVAYPVVVLVSCFLSSAAVFLSSFYAYFLFFFNFCNSFLSFVITRLFPKIWLL
jgi:hypothetical protein